MKYFTKEVKIALTAIVAVVLLFLGINFLKGINLFKSPNTYYVEFSDIKGLTVSSQVYADGYGIGLVRDVYYDKYRSGHVIVEFDVEDGLRIPKGSTASIDKEILGGANMVLLLGNNPRERYMPGDTIRGDEAPGLMQKAGEMLPKLEVSMARLDSILTSLNALLSNPALVHVIENAGVISDNLAQTSTQLNTMVEKDMPQLVGSLNRTLGHVESLSAELDGIDMAGTMNRVDATLENVRLATSKLNSSDNSIGLLLNDDAALYQTLHATVGSADSLLVDLKAHPKRYVHFSVFGKKDK